MYLSDRRAFAFANVILVCAASAYAEEPEALTEPLPSLELLEFLGQTSEVQALGLDLDAMIEELADQPILDDGTAARSDGVKSP